MMPIQPTVSEVFESIAKVANHYIGSLNRYSEEQFSYKSAADVWSLGQMYEHLTLSYNYFFLANVARCLEQRKGQIGGDKNANGDNLFKYNSFPPIKVKVPEGLRGPEPVAKSREEYIVLFKKVIADAQNVLGAVTHDTGEYKCLHPPFGWLNAREWYQMMDMHARHHLRQQVELEAFAGVLVA